RLLHVGPELPGDTLRRTARRTSLEELALEGRHERVDLLADRLAEVVRLGGREAGELLRDLHVLLLVDADAVRGGGDGLEPLVRERDRFLAVLATRVDRYVSHRARPVERADRGQVIELGRLDLPQRLAHPGPLELEHADRLSAGEHLVGLAVVERDRRDVDVGETTGLVDHVEVPEAEEAYLERSDHLDQSQRESSNNIMVGFIQLKGRE